MRHIRYKMLVPDYVLNFKCIGSNCEDSCCSGWRIDIDEDTYKKYKKIKNIEVGNKLKNKVTRNRSNSNRYSFAKIKLNENGNCPFLNDKKLCEIQMNLGEEYLSETCSSYPRRLNLIDGIMEKALSLSCPEAARLALLNRDGINFVESEEAVKETVRFTTVINTNDTKLGVGYLNYFWDIRTFTIQVLKTREYTLDERLIILGLFYKKIDELTIEKTLGKIPEIIGYYENMILSGELKQHLESIKSQNTIQMELLKELMDERVLKGCVDKRYIECYSEFLWGIGYEKNLLIAEIGQRYTEAYENYYKIFIKGNEYMLENYLVNYVFKNMIPMGSVDNVFDNYLIMVLHYALIKMHLIGISGFYKEDLNVNNVLKLIQSFAKNVEHNGRYIKDILHLLKINGYTTLSYLTILIKN